jgi:ABC-type multidrug transport system ATPase subunit
LEVLGENLHTEDISSFVLRTSNLGKRYNREWIFRNFNYRFEQGKTYAITGPNGSGKSTLLHVLWGQLPQSIGVVEYSIDSVKTPVEEIYKHVSIAAPYLDLIEEYTLNELIRFHFSMRKIREGFHTSDVLDLLELSHAKDKPLSNFSSGMRQRVKLGLALFTQSALIFLDEPFTNLDQSAIEWCKKQIGLVKDGTFFIASNNPEEYTYADVILNIQDFKGKESNILS